MADLFEAMANICVITPDRKEDLTENSPMKADLSDNDIEDNSVSGISDAPTELKSPTKIKEQKMRQVQMEEFILYEQFTGTISKENQRLLRNFKLAEVAIFFVVTIRVDRETNSNPRYTNMIKSIYCFLVGFVRQNKQN